MTDTGIRIEAEWGVEGLEGSAKLVLCSVTEINSICLPCRDRSGERAKRAREKAYRRRFVAELIRLRGGVQMVWGRQAKHLVLLLLLLRSWEIGVIHLVSDVDVCACRRVDDSGGYGGCRRKGRCGAIKAGEEREGEKGGLEFLQPPFWAKGNEGLEKVKVNIWRGRRITE